MKIIFGRNRSDKLSNILARLGGSQWSHVGIIDRSGLYVIESTIPDGVVKTHINDFKDRYTETHISTMTISDEVDPYQLAQEQIGADYDFTALISMLSSRNWEDPRAWICSELVAYCSGIFRQGSLSKISVDDIWKVSHDVRQ